MSFDWQNINFLLIVVIAVLALLAWQGYRKGFIKTLYSIIAFAAAIMITAVTAPYVEEFMNNSPAIRGFFDTKIEQVIQLPQSVTESFTDKKALPDMLEGVTVEDALTSIPGDTKVGDIAANLPEDSPAAKELRGLPADATVSDFLAVLPDDAKNADVMSLLPEGTTLEDLASMLPEDMTVDELLETLPEDAVESLSAEAEPTDGSSPLSGLVRNAIDSEAGSLPDRVTDFVSDMFASIIGKASGGIDSIIAHVRNGVADKAVRLAAYLGTFIIVMLLLKITAVILDKITRLPGLNLINRVLGLVLGMVRWYFVVSVGGVVLTLLATTAFGSACLDMIQRSSFLTLLYNCNIILKLTAKILTKGV